MSATDVIVGLLLFGGVALLLVAVLGVLAMRGVFDKLHYTAPSGLGLVLVTAAIMVRESWSLIGMKAILTTAFVLATSPVLVHATARSARIHARRDWKAQPGEDIELEDLR